jgi:glutathione S-transferase
MNRLLDVTTSFAASLVRGPSGLSVGKVGPRPAQRLELYEFEACPFCRKVREALTMLDLEAMVYPCPKGGSRFRRRAQEMGGKQQFPFLVDPNTSVKTYESDDIIAYLYKRYGAGPVPLALRLGPLTTASAGLASAIRPFSGLRAIPSRAPRKPLELWSFEASPYCRIAREALCSLELPYVLHNVGKGSPSRETFVKRSGKMMVPYLADPNTGKEMFESADIARYLMKTYAA